MKLDFLDLFYTFIVIPLIFMLFLGIIGIVISIIFEISEKFFKFMIRIFNFAKQKAKYYYSNSFPISMPIPTPLWCYNDKK